MTAELYQLARSDHHANSNLYGEATPLRAIALGFISQGAKVVVNYFPDEASEHQFTALKSEVESPDSLIGVAGDISIVDTGQRLVKATVDNFGRLDIFVSNAGSCRFADFLT